MTFLDQPRHSEENNESQLNTLGVTTEIVSGLMLGATALGIAALTAVRNLIDQARGDVITETFNSSCIHMLEYDLRSGQMIVTFQDGNVYDYPYVKPDDFLRFITAPSKGQFFNTYVRGKW